MARQVLKYLARYTHRVAISNRRLVSIEDGQVAFRYKDYRRGRRERVMRLEAVEFMRRFLLHVLPKGFVRIRHYGLLANRACKDKLRCAGGCWARLRKPTWIRSRRRRPRRPRLKAPRCARPAGRVPGSW